MDKAREIGVLLILGLLLASCFTTLWAQSIVSATPVVLSPALEQVFHEGDIVLSGNETMTLDMVAYTQNGDIVVMDNATLRITASILRVDISEEWHRIVIKGSGRLWLWDSVIEGEQIIYMKDDASAYMDKCTMIDEGLLHDGTRYYMTGFNLRGNSSLEARQSSLGIVMITDNASSEVHDSFIGSFYPLSPVESIILGSEMESLSISFRDADLEIDEGFHRYHENWETQAVFGEGCMSNLRLVDTAILEPLQMALFNCSLVLRGDIGSVIMRNGSKVRVLDTNLRLLAASSEDTHIEVENSTVYYLRGGPIGEGYPTYSLKGSRLEEANIICWRENLSATIEDCSFGTLKVGCLFSSDRPTYVHVTDTIIRNLTIVPGGRFTYTFENVTVEEGFQQEEGSVWWGDHVIIRGSLRFGEKAAFGGDRRSNANITRWYDIEFHPTRGGPVTLELKSENETIWKRDIDREGVEEFSINYLDIFRNVWPPIPGGPSVIDIYNMTDTLTLVATSSEGSVETSVGLLTDSPIRLELPVVPQEDYLVDLTTYVLVVVALVALIVFLRSRR